jgi:hypothetical protein
VGKSWWLSDLVDSGVGCGDRGRHESLKRRIDRLGVNNLRTSGPLDVLSRNGRCSPGISFLPKRIHLIRGLSPVCRLGARYVTQRS